MWMLAPVSERSMNPVLWGLEEEGIPVRVQEFSAGSADDLARQAAQGSPLDVGIGLDGTGRKAILLHRDLLKEKPFLLLQDDDFTPVELRRLGTNAARLVKRQPLVLDRASIGSVTKENSSNPPEDEVEALVNRIVNFILENR